ncbi:MAG: glycosyltransferase family 8 protein [Clostridiales bacterium]|nr:glycosyltransferase family 8 protein [Clostridiales bacterium]
MSMKTEIPIFFTIDDSYAPYLGVALQSLVSNASDQYIYHIYIIYDSLSEENKGKLFSVVKGCLEKNDHTGVSNSGENRKKVDVRFVKMADTLQGIADRKENRLRCDYFTLTIYFRLFLADMFPRYDKGIYLDSDIVVPGDISKMYQVDLEDNIIGACRDHSIEDIPELIRYMEGAIGVDRTEYINSGILLLNMKKMREVDLSGHFLRLLHTYHFDCIAPDQDYLNAMCNGQICYLNRTWDVMPNPNQEPAKNPGLIHYNLFDKPWCYDDIQYEEYFWKYAQETVYFDELVKFKQNYSEKQKKDDAQHMDDLIEKSDRLSCAEGTFRKIEKSGVKIKL